MTATPAQPTPEVEGLSEGYAVSARLHDPLTPGTRVLAWPGSRESSPLVTRTRGEVWTLGDGTPIVRVEGHAGGIALTHVDVLPDDQARATEIRAAELEAAAVDIDFLLRLAAKRLDRESDYRPSVPDWLRARAQAVRESGAGGGDRG